MKRWLLALWFLCALGAGEAQAQATCIGDMCGNPPIHVGPNSVEVSGEVGAKSGAFMDKVVITPASPFDDTLTFTVATATSNLVRPTVGFTNAQLSKISALVNSGSGADLQTNSGATAHITAFAAGQISVAAWTAVPTAGDTVQIGATSAVTAWHGVSTVGAQAGYPFGIFSATGSSVWAVDYAGRLSGSANLIAAGTVMGNPTGAAAVPSAMSQSTARSTLGLGSIVTPASFGSLGSSQSTTGAIASGSPALTLAAAGDFKNGQDVLVVGAGAATAAATPAGLAVTATGTAGATTYSYRISSDDGFGGLSAAATAVTITNGNASLTTAHYNHLAWSVAAGAVTYQIWRSTGGGAYVFAGKTALTTFNDNGGSFTKDWWLPATPNTSVQAKFFVGTILSGAGTTALTLTTNATATAPASAAVRHDDTAALQAAINAAAAFNSTSSTPEGFLSVAAGAVELAAGGVYNISSGLTFGTALVLYSPGQAQIALAGNDGTILTSTTSIQVRVANVTFIDGGQHFSLGNANIDAANYRFDNVQFINSTLPAIVTAGDYSTIIEFYSVRAIRDNGLLSSEADFVNFIGGWWESSPYTWITNTPWVKQSRSATYFFNNWNFTNVQAIPVQTDGSVDISDNRWVDCTGVCSFFGFRTGGEGQGIPMVKVASTLSAVGTYNGAVVNIVGGAGLAEPSWSPAGTVLLGGIPASVNVSGLQGPFQGWLVKEATGFTFATALTTWKTAASITDATPYIRFSLDIADLRTPAFAWPPAGVAWPASIQPYVTSYHITGTWTATDGSGAGLVLATSDTNYVINNNVCTLSFFIVYPPTADVSNSKISGVPAACTAKNGSNNTVFQAVLNSSGTATLATIVRNTNAINFVDLSNAALSNTALGTRTVTGTLSFQIN